jgi:hypothetical protein
MMDGATADGGAVLILCVTFCVADDVLVELLTLLLLLVFTFCELTVLFDVDVFTLLLLLVDKFVLLDVEFTVLVFVLVTFCV